MGTKTRVPIKFSVACYEAQTHQLPDGREVSIPRHWRLIDAQQNVIGSGPYPSEPVMLGLLKMAQEYMREHPQGARAIMANLQHIERKLIMLPSTHQPSEVQ